MAHEGQAVVDAVRLEAEKVEAPARLGRVRLAREVDELGQRPADLQSPSVSPEVNIREDVTEETYVNGNVAHNGRVIR